MKWAQKWFPLTTNVYMCVCVQSVKNVKEKQTSSPQKCHPQKNDFPLLFPPSHVEHWAKKSQHMVGYVCLQMNRNDTSMHENFPRGKALFAVGGKSGREWQTSAKPESRDEDVTFVGSWRRSQDCGNIKQLRGIILGGGGSFRLDISYAFWEKIRKFLPFCYCCLGGGGKSFALIPADWLRSQVGAFLGSEYCLKLLGRKEAELDYQVVQLVFRAVYFYEKQFTFKGWLKANPAVCYT